MSSPYRFAFSSFVVSTVVGLVVACGASGDSEPILATDEAGTLPAPTSALPGPGPDAAGLDAAKDAATDASKPDAANDAAPDSAVDAGKPAPNAGDACAAVDEIFARTCGVCGSQLAICLAAPDGGAAGVVSSYSACENELADGCLPGATEVEECGNCGTRQRTCTQLCAWSPGACNGQPVSSCAPTSQDYTTAGCPTAGTVRTRACDGACTWSNFTGTCDPLAFKLVAASVAGESVSAIYPLRALVADKRMTGTCPNGYFSSTTNHPYVYVEIVNPTESALTLSAWNTAASSSAPIIDTLMAWYEGNALPTDEATRKACAKGVGDSCPSGLPCGDSKWAGLTTTKAITLPPFGSALVYFGSYYPAGGASLAEGDVKLVVRTDALE